MVRRRNDLTINMQIILTSPPMHPPQYSLPSPTTIIPMAINEDAIVDIMYSSNYIRRKDGTIAIVADNKLATKQTIEGVTAATILWGE